MISSTKKYKISIQEINPKSKVEFDKNASCFIGVSLGNPKFDIKYFPSLLNWVNENFKECTIVIVDYIYRYNLMIEKGLDEKQATIVALDLGDKTKKMLEDIKPNTKFKIYQWQDKKIATSADYKKKCIASMMSNLQIIKDIEMDVTSYLKRKNIQFDKKSKSFEYGFNYVLEELLFVNHRIENQNLYSVYPGNQLQTMKNFSNGKYLKQTDLALNQLICIDLKIKK